MTSFQVIHWYSSKTGRRPDQLMIRPSKNTLGNIGRTTVMGLWVVPFGISPKLDTMWTSHDFPCSSAPNPCWGRDIGVVFAVKIADIVAYRFGEQDVDAIPTYAYTGQYNHVAEQLGRLCRDDDNGLLVTKLPGGYVKPEHIFLASWTGSYRDPNLTVDEVDLSFWS